MRHTHDIHEHLLNPITGTLLALARGSTTGLLHYPMVPTRIITELQFLKGTRLATPVTTNTQWVRTQFEVFSFYVLVFPRMRCRFNVVLRGVQEVTRHRCVCVREAFASVSNRPKTPSSVHGRSRVSKPAVTVLTLGASFCVRVSNELTVSKMRQPGFTIPGTAATLGASAHKTC